MGEFNACKQLGLRSLADPSATIVEQIMFADRAGDTAVGWPSETRLPSAFAWLPTSISCAEFVRPCSLFVILLLSLWILVINSSIGHAYSSYMEFSSDGVRMRLLICDDSERAYVEIHTGSWGFAFEPVIKYFDLSAATLKPGHPIGLSDTGIRGTIRSCPRKNLLIFEDYPDDPDWLDAHTTHEWPVDVSALVAAPGDDITVSFSVIPLYRTIWLRAPEEIFGGREIFTIDKGDVIDLHIIGVLDDFDITKQIHDIQRLTGITLNPYPLPIIDAIDMFTACAQGRLSSIQGAGGGPPNLYPHVTGFIADPYIDMLEGFMSYVLASWAIAGKDQQQAILACGDVEDEIVHIAQERHVVSEENLLLNDFRLGEGRYSIFLKHSRTSAAHYRPDTAFVCRLIEANDQYWETLYDQVRNIQYFRSECKNVKIKVDLLAEEHTFFRRGKQTRFIRARTDRKILEAITVRNDDNPEQVCSRVFMLDLFYPNLQSHRQSNDVRVRSMYLLTTRVNAPFQPIIKDNQVVLVGLKGRELTVLPTTSDPTCGAIQ